MDHYSVDALAGLRVREPPFDPAPPCRLAGKANWVRPEVVIRAEFAG